MIYLDNSATTRVMPEARAAAEQYMSETFFNPSAAYGAAAKTEKEVNSARERIATLTGAKKNEIIFTSGGTESNNTAIFGALSGVRGKKRIITTMVEHPSVFEVFQHLERDNDTEVIYLPVDHSGIVSIDALDNALTEETALVSVMHVNNEVGAINPIREIASSIRKKSPSAVFHVDGVQAFGKLPFDMLPCDMYSVSGHKLQAPKGIGFLLVRDGARFGGGLIGGGQESGRRSGTTNTAGIMALDAALAQYRVHQSEWIDHMYHCKSRLAELLLSIDDAVLNGPSAETGAPHILNVSFPGVRGEVLLHALSQKEIFVSTGSACSTHKRGKNRILNAMNITGSRQDGAIRFSSCPFNTIDEIEIAAQAVREQVTFLRRYQRR